MLLITKGQNKKGELLTTSLTYGIDALTNDVRSYEDFVKIFDDFDRYYGDIISLFYILNNVSIFILKNIDKLGDKELCIFEFFAIKCLSLKFENEQMNRIFKEIFSNIYNKLDVLTDAFLSSYCACGSYSEIIKTMLLATLFRRFSIVIDDKIINYNLRLIADNFNHVSHHDKYNLVKYLACVKEYIKDSEVIHLISDSVFSYMMNISDENSDMFNHIQSAALDVFPSLMKVDISIVRYESSDECKLKFIKLLPLLSQEQFSSVLHKIYRFLNLIDYTNVLAVYKSLKDLKKVVKKDMDFALSSDEDKYPSFVVKSLYNSNNTSFILNNIKIDLEKNDINIILASITLVFLSDSSKIERFLITEHIIPMLIPYCNEKSVYIILKVVKYMIINDCVDLNVVFRKIKNIIVIVNKDRYLTKKFFKLFRYFIDGGDKTLLNTIYSYLNSLITNTETSSFIISCCLDSFKYFEEYEELFIKHITMSALKTIKSVIDTENDAEVIVNSFELIPYLISDRKSQDLRPLIYPIFQFIVNNLLEGMRDIFLKYRTIHTLSRISLIYTELFDDVVDDFSFLLPIELIERLLSSESELIIESAISYITMVMPFYEKRKVLHIFTYCVNKCMSLSNVSMTNAVFKFAACLVPKITSIDQSVEVLVIGATLFRFTSLDNIPIYDYDTDNLCYYKLVSRLVGKGYSIYLSPLVYWIDLVSFDDFPKLAKVLITGLEKCSLEVSFLNDLYKNLLETFDTLLEDECSFTAIIKIFKAIRENYPGYNLELYLKKLLSLVNYKENEIYINCNIVPELITLLNNEQHSNFTYLESSLVHSIIGFFKNKNNCWDSVLVEKFLNILNNLNGFHLEYLFFLFVIILHDESTLEDKNIEDISSYEEEVHSLLIDKPNYVDSVLSYFKEHPKIDKVREFLSFLR